jgi:hypothetical protein
VALLGVTAIPLSLVLRLNGDRIPVAGTMLPWIFGLHAGLGAWLGAAVVRRHGARHRFRWWAATTVGVIAAVIAAGPSVAALVGCVLALAALALTGREIARGPGG